MLTINLRGDFYSEKVIDCRKLRRCLGWKHFKIYNLKNALIPCELSKCRHLRDILNNHLDVLTVARIVFKNLENWEGDDIYVSESHKSRREREFFLKILKIEKRCFKIL